MRSRPGGAPAGRCRRTAGGRARRRLRRRGPARRRGGQRAPWPARRRPPPTARPRRTGHHRSTRRTARRAPPRGRGGCAGPSPHRPAPARSASRAGTADAPPAITRAAAAPLPPSPTVLRPQRRSTSPGGWLRTWVPYRVDLIGEAPEEVTGRAHQSDIEQVVAPQLHRTGEPRGPVDEGQRHGPRDGRGARRAPGGETNGRTRPPSAAASPARPRPPAGPAWARARRAARGGSGRSAAGRGSGAGPRRRATPVPIGSPPARAARCRAPSARSARPCVGPVGASVARGAAVMVTAGTYRRTRCGSMAARRCFADRKRVRGRLEPAPSVRSPR